MDKVAQALALHAKMVDTACASETKRQSVSITSAALISAGAAWLASDRNFVAVYMILPGMILTSIWSVTVRYYQQLAKAKWDVIHEIEEHLAFQPFKREWELYTSRKGLFTFGPSTLEQIIPAVLFLVSLGEGARWLFMKICN